MLVPLLDAVHWHALRLGAYGSLVGVQLCGLPRPMQREMACAQPGSRTVKMRISPWPVSPGSGAGALLPGSPV